MAKHKLNKLYTILVQDKETGKYYGIINIHELNDCKSVVYSAETKGNLNVEGTNPNSHNQKIWFYLRERAQLFSLVSDDRYIIKPYRINSKSCPVKFNLKEFRKYSALKDSPTWSWVKTTYVPFEKKIQE